MWKRSLGLYLYFGRAIMIISLMMLAGAVLVPYSFPGDRMVLGGAALLALVALGFILMGREFIRTAFKDPFYGYLKRPAEYGFALGTIEEIEYRGASGSDDGGGAYLFCGVYKDHAGKEQKTGGQVDGRLGRLLLAASRRNKGRLPSVQAWFMFMLNPPPENPDARLDDMVITSALAGIPAQAAEILRKTPPEDDAEACRACGLVFAGQNCPHCGSPAGRGLLRKLARLFGAGKRSEEVQPEDDGLVSIYTGDQTGVELLANMLEEEGLDVLVRQVRGAAMPELAVLVDRNDEVKAKRVLNDFRKEVKGEDR